MLDDLYQELIVDHGRHPRNHHAMDDCTHCAEGHNPLCGDELQLYLRVENGRLTDLSFIGSGCAISQASASMLTEELRGKTIEEAIGLSERLRQLMTSDADANDLGALSALLPVRTYPMRVKCVTLAWHTLTDALRRTQ